ncbi:MAG TPA: methylisocitrate lyase [Chthonomonas sp.]|uniref:methylisocitrate lyase n=1 Tax=Chthonomonas sp. TaxID=2282153 RepID=UPI002B4AFFA2|nr:methylisocitrate lyase [Chthonomonas sp.]HLI49201.1 methylisocitrate lyase [Chthonomonas sp.]
MTLSPGAQLRARLKKGLLVLPGVFNAITALLAEQVGFEALYLSGAGVTNSLLGMPDMALLTLTEMAQQARYVARAVKLPVVADADTGYGEALNVVRTVEEFEQAGLAGLHLEDQVAPKRCGHLDGKQVIPAEEMVKKIRAAVRARSDPDFFLIARTDARSVNGLEDAIVRAQRYLEAGADAIFPESLESRAEFETFAKAVSAPLMANMTEFGKTPYLRAQEFAEMGYAMVIFPMTAFRVMMHAAREALHMLKETGTQQGLIDRMQTRKELYELLRYADYERLDREIAEGDR